MNIQFSLQHLLKTILSPGSGALKQNKIPFYLFKPSLQDILRERKEKKEKLQSVAFCALKPAIQGWADLE